MKVKTIRADWLERDGRRLDCNPYMTGAIEARATLEALRVRKDPLHSITRGHNGGIYNGPQFARRWVEDPKYGVPFLGSSDVLNSDLSMLPYFQRKLAQSPKLAHLEVKPGMTLITCSGTIGRMVFARPDMDGMWSSQHVIKVVPDESKIPPGYLYVFLSSKFGVPLVVGGTYGAIIQHIEPEHIAHLPVPRFDDPFERDIDRLIRKASIGLASSQEKVRNATALLFDSVGLKDIPAEEWHRMGPDLDFVESKPSVASLRALNFNPRFKNLIEAICRKPHKPLGEICVPGTLKRGGRYKRIDASPEYAYRLIGQKELFYLRPEGRWIAKSSVGNDVLVDEGTILVAAQGTLGESEVYCRAEFAWGPYVTMAYSEHLLRVVADEAVMPRGCLYAFMRSETAFRMLRSISVGTKLQDQHYAFKAQLPVPYPNRKLQVKIHDLVVSAYESRHHAIRLLDQAQMLLEKKIDEAA